MGSARVTHNKDNTKLVQRTTLLISMLTSFVFPFAGSSLNLAIPFIGEDFQAPATSLTWVISAMMLANISLSVPFGRFADIWGRRRVFTIGVILFGIATLLCAFATSFATLIVLRIFQGVGGAMFIATNMAILMEVFPAQQRGRVLGYSAMCTYIGLSLGPVVGGLLIHYFSWHAIFFATSSVAFFIFVIAMISTSKLLKVRNQATEGSRVNPVSIALYMTAMLAFMYGFTVFGQSIYSYFILAAGLLLLLFFARHELRVTSPVIAVGLFKNNLNFIFSNIAAYLNYAATGALSYILTLYLVVLRGFQPDTVGLLLIIQPALMAIISPIMGRLSDKRSPFLISSVGMAICTVALLLFLFLNEDTSLVFIVVNLLIVGVGFGTFSSPNTNAAMSCVTPKDYAVANSILATMRLLGQLSSMAVITIIIHFTIGNALISEAGNAGMMSVFHTTFIVFALLCLLGVLLSLGRKQKRQQ